jgi:hypothetical protein
MNYIIAGLAVYKMLQILDVLTPKEAMPWVKIVFGVLLGYVSTLLLVVPNVPLSGLVIGTIAGTVHGLLRLLTLLGDWAQRKATR